MGRERQGLVLGVLFAVFTAAAAYMLWPRPPVDATRTLNDTAAGEVSSARKAESPVGPAVRLETLDGQRPKPAVAQRNLFRFKPKPVPPPPVAPSPPPSGSTQASNGPPGPPRPTGPPPIPLKFIGITEAPQQSWKIAVLKSTDGSVVYGLEGQIVDGRYRIVRIGNESIELTYLDGQGRQTIRLSGG